MKKKMKINPILRKELVVGSRNMKMSWGIFGFNAFLALIVVFVMMILNANSGMNGSYDFGDLVTLFPVLGCVECGVLSLVVPIITSGSISGERERQTLDIMLTTPVKPFSIALGKLGSAMMLVMIYMVSSIPVMAIAFVLGGMNWGALFGLIVMMLYLGAYVGSVGIFCSSIVKKSIAATVLTIVIGIGIIVVTGIIFGIGTSIVTYYQTVHNNIASYSPGALPVILMFNPYTPFADFMFRSMSSYSIYDIIAGAGKMPVILTVIYKAWIPVSMFLNLLIAFGFLKLAARNIAVTHNRK